MGGNFDQTSSITAGPDGNLWFLDATSARVVRVTLPRSPTGTLTPGSDRGPSQTDGVTDVNRPTFAGVGRPGDVVRLVARPSDGSAPRALGAATVRRGGSWRLTARRPLPDGSYTVMASPGPPLSPLGGASPLVIDTVAPRITGFAVTPSSSVGSPPGAAVTFQDKGSGLLTNLDVYPTLISPSGSFYKVTRLRGAKPVQTNDSIGTSTNPTPPPNEAIESDLSITDPQFRPGDRYRVRVVARNSTDLAGNHLDGESHAPRFPSGNGRPGGDFVAVIDSPISPKSGAAKT